MNLNVLKSSLICPLSKTHFQDPILASDGYTYERYAWMSWVFEGHRTSPVTGEVLEDLTVWPNLAIEKLMDFVNKNEEKKIY